MPQNPAYSGEIWRTPKEASRITGFAEQTLANWRCLRIGPPYEKVGNGRAGRIRYPESGLIEWMRNQKASAA